MHDWVERSYDNEDIDAPMGHLLGGVKSIYSYDLLLEVKRKDQMFQHYKPGGKFKLDDLLFLCLANVFMELISEKGFL